MNPYKSFAWIRDLLSTLWDLVVSKPKKRPPYRRSKASQLRRLHAHLIRNHGFDQAKAPRIYAEWCKATSLEFAIASSGNSWRRLYHACRHSPPLHPMRKEMVELLISRSDNAVRRSQAERLRIESQISSPNTGFVEGDPDAWKK